VLELVQDDFSDNCGGMEDEQVMCFLVVKGRQEQGKIMEKVKETIEYYGK
jgi:hypothetical protein